MNTIQATELRVGNLFRFISTDSIEQVADIRTAGIKTPTINNVLIADCEPIPLNEDWLVRFKWDCFQEGWYGLNKYGLGHEFTWNIYDGMLRWKGSAIDCKFVHQLQNIHHSIKVTELTLTDK